MAKDDKKKPFLVSSHDIHTDTDYSAQLAELKERYRATQIKAAVKVNSQQLLFNWQLGRELVMRKAEEKWGSGIVEQVSLDLQAEFPQARGFSTTNLWYMKKWYLFYTQFSEKDQKSLFMLDDWLDRDSEKLHQLGGEMPDGENPTNLVEKWSSPQLSDLRHSVIMQR